jgi:hypothetical protein
VTGYVDPEQIIKTQIVMLAEYLQTKLTDDQVRLYARDLSDIGPEGMATAIRRLRADPALWAGKFPLPSKIRSYLLGDIDDRAVESASRILDCYSWMEAKEKLNPTEYAVMKKYGVRAVTDRFNTDTKTIFAQLRDLMKAAYGKEIIYGKPENLIGEAGSEDKLRIEGTDEMRELLSKVSRKQDA